MGLQAVIGPVYAKTVFGTATSLGFVVGAFGIGALAGSLLFGAVGRNWSRRLTFTVCYVLGPLVLFGSLAVTPPLPILVGRAAVSGLIFGPINPVAASVIQDHTPPENRRPRLSRSDGEPIVAYELDAVGLALELAGMDRRPVLRSWHGTESAPFLEGLSQFQALEDRMIEHDARVFGGWDLLQQGAVGIVEFSQGARKLTVINVNRAGVEHALGVDLVYYNHEYNHEFQAYVLVQYKRMTPRSDGGFEFRPDRQTRKELDRMRRIMPSGAGPSSIREFRLDPFGAYLKLCPSTVTDAFAEDLIKGMYLPLGYWDVLVDSPNVLGPKGGVVVNYDNVGRYMNNSIFIDLVGASWIGSRGATTKQITAVIRGALQTRSLILAEASGPVERRW